MFPHVLWRQPGWASPVASCREQRHSKARGAGCGQDHFDIRVLDFASEVERHKTHRRATLGTDPGPPQQGSVPQTLILYTFDAEVLRSPDRALHPHLPCASTIHHS